MVYDEYRLGAAPGDRNGSTYQPTSTSFYRFSHHHHVGRLDDGGLRAAQRGRAA